MLNLVLSISLVVLKKHHPICDSKIDRLELIVSQQCSDFETIPCEDRLGLSWTNLKLNSITEKFRILELTYANSSLNSLGKARDQYLTSILKARHPASSDISGFAYCTALAVQRAGDLRQYFWAPPRNPRERSAIEWITAMYPAADYQYMLARFMLESGTARPYLVPVGKRLLKLDPLNDSLKYALAIQEAMPGSSQDLEDADHLATQLRRFHPERASHFGLHALIGLDRWERTHKLSDGKDALYRWNVFLSTAKNNKAARNRTLQTIGRIKSEMALWAKHG